MVSNTTYFVDKIDRKLRTTDEGKTKIDLVSVPDNRQYVLHVARFFDCLSLKGSIR